MKPRGFCRRPQISLFLPPFHYRPPPTPSSASSTTLSAMKAERESHIGGRERRSLRPSDSWMEKTLEKSGRNGREAIFSEAAGGKKSFRIQVREWRCCAAHPELWMSEKDRRFCRFSHPPFTQSYHFCPYSPPYLENPSTSLLTLPSRSAPSWSQTFSPPVPACGRNVPIIYCGYTCSRKPENFSLCSEVSARRHWAPLNFSGAVSEAPFTPNVVSCFVFFISAEESINIFFAGSFHPAVFR